MKQRTILITGAAGLIGSHLAEAFAAAGWAVRALDLPGRLCAEASAAGAAVGTVELGRPEGALRAAELAAGCDLVAHAAFPPDGDLETALALARAGMAAALQSGAPFLLLSSCTVYGRPQNLPCDEGDLKAPIERHGVARWAVEREAFLWRRTRGLRMAVLRPALTYGPRQQRGLGAAIVVSALAARAGRALWLPRRGPVLHTVHAADVARAAVLLAARMGELDGHAFNVADDVPLPLEELARAILEATGTRERGWFPYAPLPARLLLWALRHLPPWVLWRRLNRRMAQRWVEAFEGAPPGPVPRLDPDVLEHLAADRYYDTQRLRALGFVPLFPSAVEGLRQLIREDREQGLLPGPRRLALPG